MASRTTTEACVLAVVVGFCIAARTVVGGGNITDGLALDWGHGNVSKDGQIISLYLDQQSGGSGLKSKDTYLFARTDLKIKLVPNNSAGTVTTCFFLSEGPWEKHDEIDLEFLGNTTGKPYTLHTNIFVNGNGSKEQQFRLWFDPAADFHTYSIVWTPRHILVLVDGTPLREFRNHTNRGVPYPASQRMRLYGSLWNADDWATQGGRVKTDWSHAPFSASYRGFKADACVVVAGGRTRCGATVGEEVAPGTGAAAVAGDWYNQELDLTRQQRMRSVQRKYMIYNYCTDPKRYAQGLPAECSM